MSIYSKSLAGIGAKLFVSAAVEYTDDTTFGAFIDNAVEGEIGVFLESGAVKTTALAATERFFIAQKRDTFVNKTPVMLWSDLQRKLRTAYDAPVRQVSYLGYAATGTATLGFSFTGASNTNTQTYGISLRDTTPGNQPFPVQEASVAVNSATADQYTVAAQLVSQLNADNDYAGNYPYRFAKAEIVSNSVLTELTQNLTVVNLSKTITAAGSITIATGALVSIRGTIYKVAVGGTGTSFTLDRPYQGASETIAVGSTVDQAATAAYTSGTTLLGIKLTANNDESHFQISADGLLYGTTITYTTAWKLGSGSGASIVEVEKNDLIFFDGIGSTRNAAFSADYGQPTLFAVATKNYHLIFLDFANAYNSAALPHYRQSQLEKIIIAAPTDATTPDNELTTIFGV